MKTKAKKRKDEKKDQSITLPSPTSIPIQPTKHASELKKWSGKWQDKSTVAYLAVLPSIRSNDTMHYLEQLRDSFLLFLKKASCMERSEVWFGGMDFSIGENVLTLHTAFCPFSERLFVPQAKIYLDDLGSIQKITLIKKHT